MPQVSAAGGVKTGAFYEGFVSLGTDLDMNRIAGIPGATIHLLVGDLQGPPYFGFSGSLFAFNRAWVFGDEFRYNELSWEQTFGKRVRVLVGRITPSVDYGNLSVFCQFAYSLCAAPGLFVFDKSAPPYLTSTWGGTVTLKPSAPTYVKFGIYEDQASLARGNFNNWPGADWGLNLSTGAFVPLEIGYLTTLRTDPYPKHYAIGAFWDTSKYADPVLNTHGQSRVLSGGAPLIHKGRTAIYLLAQQMVWRPEPTGDRGLTAFASAAWSTSGVPSIEQNVVVGLWDQGPFRARPNDSIGFALEYIGVDHRVSQRLDDTLLRHGIAGRISPNEFSFELNYGIGIAPGIVFKPFLQYTLNPDQFLAAVPNPKVTGSFFLGAAITIGFNQAFGLPALFRRPY